MAQEASFFTEDLFRELGDHLPDFIWVREVETGRILYVNPSWERITGRRPPIGAHYREFFAPIHPDDIERAHEAAIEFPLGGYNERLRFVHASGSIRWLHLRTFPIRDATGRVYRVAGVGEDVTDVHLARESHEATQKKFRALVEHSTDLIGVIGPDGTLQYLSPMFETVLGFRAREWLGRPMVEIVWPDDLPQALQLLRRSLASPGRVIEWELRVKHQDGSWRWLEGAGTNYISDPAVAGIVVNCRDVSERRARDESFRSVQRAIDTALNAVAIADAGGRMTYVNPAFVRLWGFDSEAEVLGKTPMEMGSTGDARAVLEALAEHGAYLGEITGLRRDGTVFPVLISGSAVRDEEGRLVSMMASFQDLSEQKRLQQQLIQAQKMESVGRLAGGLAHDFNNLLTVIKGNASLAKLDLRRDDPLWSSVDRIEEAADSAASLTQQLLAFSRKQIIDPKVISLNAVIARTQRMLARLIGEDVALEARLAPRLDPVCVDPAQIEQILVNLAVNARDAMPEGGTLTIETANARLDAEYAREHQHVSPGDYVMLAVSDTGSGMTSEVRQHLFEPFFTTKEEGKGTGLGLSMVYGAVKQNGGYIEVVSEVGEGARFMIYLPRVDASPEAEAPRTVARATGGSETILLVEDAEPVRMFAAGLLTRLGYTVRACADGVEALEVVERLGYPVRLLVTDVVMPKMNGQALAEQVRARRPDVRVLFTSGYTSSVIVNHGVLKEGVEFLPKPYSVEDLARRVREVLDKGA